MSVEALSVLLNGDDDTARAYAAEDLGCGDEPGALAALMDRVVIEECQPVREALFTALERLSAPAVSARLAELLGHEDPYVRNSAVGVLQSKGAAALPALRRAFESTDADVRKLVFDVLCAVDAADDEPLYAAGLGDENVNVRISAVECLGEHRKVGFRAVLEELFLSATDPMMENALYGALSAIGDEGTWQVVARRHPRFELVPPYQRGPWLAALAGFERPEVALEVLSVNAAAIRPADLLDALRTLRDRRATLEPPAPLREHLARLLRGDVGAELRAKIAALLGADAAPAPEAPAPLATPAAPAALACEGRRRARLSRKAPPGGAS